MFDLAAQDLSRRILDCSAGSASFNAEVTVEGRSVVSCDPLYRFTAREIRDLIEEPYEVVLASAEANRECYVWKDVGRRPGWARCGCGPCDASSMTSRKDLRKDAIVRMVYPRWVSVIPGST